MAIGELGRDAELAPKRTSIDLAVKPLTERELWNATAAPVWRRNTRAFRLCYEGALKKTPDLEGRLVVHVDITEDGVVTKVETSGPLTSPTLLTCLKKHIARLQFPPPPTESGPMKFDSNFIFRQER